MLKEVLPLDKGISSSGIRHRILDIGKQLDADIERDIAKLPQAVADMQARESSHVAAVSVDSAWLRNCNSARGPGRHVNIVAGRATFIDGPPKLYAYVVACVPRLAFFVAFERVVVSQFIHVRMVAVRLAVDETHFCDGKRQMGEPAHRARAPRRKSARHFVRTVHALSNMQRFLA
ncbi:MULTISPECIES: hypothetical protein [unclassified Paraburkholderia]|jgi:hypothetical protein|uniref:hypothetical protein n=1 Tax=unclassified Paraburkholderia TaxID=2615204 RepID=UPI0038B78FF0